MKKKPAKRKRKKPSVIELAVNVAFRQNDCGCCGQVGVFHAEDDEPIFEMSIRGALNTDRKERIAKMLTALMTECSGAMPPNLN